jgi:hypothetical protein
MGLVDEETDNGWELREEVLLNSPLVVDHGRLKLARLNQDRVGLDGNSPLSERAVGTFKGLDTSETVSEHGDAIPRADRRELDG